MLKAWSHEELECLRAAVHSNIQLKVVANHLGRTVSAISKVITRQGIRAISRTRGKPKGSRRDVPLAQKLDQDMQTMKRLTTFYLGESAEIKSQLFSSRKHVATLKVLEGRDRALRGKKGRNRIEPTHISASLALAKAWAQEAGISFQSYHATCSPTTPLYQVEHKLVTETKLIMMINHARMEKGLRPFSIDELCWD